MRIHEFELDLNTFISIITTIVITIVVIVYKFNTLKNIMEAFVGYKDFQKYNSILNYVNRKSSRYNLTNIVVSPNSSELFNIFKSIYDYESKITIAEKILKFSLYEVTDNKLIHKSIVRFADYFLERNGMEIIFFLSDSTEKRELQYYIAKMDIKKLKVI